MARQWTCRLDFAEREKGFLMGLPRLEFSPIKSQSGEKLGDDLVNHRGEPNADVTKGEFLPHRKKKDYLETWGKD